MRGTAGDAGGTRSAPRIASLVLAAVLALVLTAYPHAAIGPSGRVSHGLLALLLWGVCAGFVHGVGFEPRARLWRVAFGPWVGLPVMAVGALLLARNVIG
jgi:cyd operon protein YbgE